MERDLRRTKGEWRGCHNFDKIICDGDLPTSSERRGGLKMGQRYYYYVSARYRLGILLTCAYKIVVRDKRFNRDLRPLIAYYNSLPIPPWPDSQHIGRARGASDKVKECFNELSTKRGLQDDGPSR